MHEAKEAGEWNIKEVFSASASGKLFSLREKAQTIQMYIANISLL